MRRESFSNLLTWLKVFCVLLLILVLLQNWRSKEWYLQQYYDFTNPQKEINTHSEIDKTLSQFETIAFEKLDKEYLDYTKSDKSKYKNLLEKEIYYKLKRQNFFEYIVDDIRIKELISKDKYYKKALSDKSFEYYWLIDKKLLHKLLELKHALKKKGYNPNGFIITNGHRHPKYNEQKGGASKSRHIKGEALDLGIRDIDFSGRYEAKDKQIVLDLLENKIIKSEGGVGRYPGTSTVHFDVRGYKARWDKQ